MPLKWTDKHRVVIVVIDYSDSMRSFSNSIYDGCAALKKKNPCADTAYHFIGFSNDIRESSDIYALHGMHGSTCIAPAFKTIHKLLFKHGIPDQIDVLFISDGQDDNMRTCVESLSRLKELPCKSRLFCVGVRAGFPTALVTEDLYPKFGKDSDPSAPPVIPLESTDEVDWVFEQLADLLSTDKAPPPPKLEDFTEASTPEELCQGSKRAYNACMHGCLFGKRIAEMQALKECSRILERIYGVAALQVRAAKLSGGTLTRRLQVLPSMLFAREGEARAAAMMSPSMAAKTAMELRAKVQECINHVERNTFLAQLDNDTKRRIAGFAGRFAFYYLTLVCLKTQADTREMCRYGVYTMKALKYHGADVERTRAGFLETLRCYNPGRMEDRDLEDEISGYTQEDFFLDAQKVLPEFEASTHTIIDILHKVPLIGRTLTILPTCDGAAMNPWLIEVVGMPTFVKFMTTYDLLHTAPDVLNMRANRTAMATAPASLPAGVAYVPQLELDDQFSQFNLLQSDDSEDGRVAAELNEMAELEERTMERQNRERGAREPSWGGIEDFSGYLTEYEDAEDGGMQKRRLEYSPPPETINHLLILPGSVGKSLRAGWMHQAATYLSLRNETLYYPDAWMATMAATVTYLLSQPEAGIAGWIQTELGMVQRSFKAVYHNENASRFYMYLSLLSSPEDYRQTLVTSGDWLPPGICCQHLTKHVFAMWLLIADMRVKFTKEALVERHCSFLVEFFNRAKVGLEWKKKAPLIHENDWIDANVPIPDDPMACSPFLATALSAYGKTLDEALRSVEGEDVLPPPELDMAALMSARHFQFSMESIGRTFATLARLCGVEDYDAAFPANAPLRLARLLSIASLSDNLSRSATYPGAPLAEPSFFQLGNRKALREFKEAVAESGRSRFKFKFELRMFHAHLGPAKTIPATHVETFKARWGIDLDAKLCIRKCGLSAVACTSPDCPYFLQRLDAADPTTKDGVGSKLRLHIASISVVPGLHRAVQVLLEEDRSDDEDAKVGMAEMVLSGRGLETGALDIARAERDRDRRLAYWGKDALARPGYAAPRIADINAKHDSAVLASKTQYMTRLRERINKAFVMRGLDTRDDAATWLKHVMVDVAGEKGKWDYADFESAVLSSPLARCPLTGRFGVVLSRP
jgi:hypothetical protein